MRGRSYDPPTTEIAPYGGEVVVLKEKWNAITLAGSLKGYGSPSGGADSYFEIGIAPMDATSYDDVFATTRVEGGALIIDETTLTHENLKGLYGYKVGWKAYNGGDVNSTTAYLSNEVHYLPPPPISINGQPPSLDGWNMTTVNILAIGWGWHFGYRDYFALDQLPRGYRAQIQSRYSMDQGRTFSRWGDSLNWGGFTVDSGSGSGSSSGLSHWTASSFPQDISYIIVQFRIADTSGTYYNPTGPNTGKAGEAYTVFFPTPKTVLCPYGGSPKGYGYMSGLETWETWDPNRPQRERFLETPSLSIGKSDVKTSEFSRIASKVLSFSTDKLDLPRFFTRWEASYLPDFSEVIASRDWVSNAVSAEISNNNTKPIYLRFFLRLAYAQKNDIPSSKIPRIEDFAILGDVYEYDVVLDSVYPIWGIVAKGNTKVPINDMRILENGVLSPRDSNDDYGWQIRGETSR